MGVMSGSSSVLRWRRPSGAGEDRNQEALHGPYAARVAPALRGRRGSQLAVRVDRALIALRWRRPSGAGEDGNLPSRKRRESHTAGGAGLPELEDVVTKLLTCRRLCCRSVVLADVVGEVAGSS